MHKDGRRRPGLLVVSWICGALPLCALLLAFPAQVQAGGGAFAVDDAEVGAPGTCKVETWASGADNPDRDRIGVISPACVANIGRPVEIGAAWQRARSAGDWESTATLKAKINLLPVETGRLGLALAGAVSWDLATSLHSETAIDVPMTLQLAETFKLNAKAGWLHDPVGERHSLSYGAGLEWAFLEPVTLIAEVFGLAGHRTDTPSERDPRLQVGLRFTPTESADIDVIFGRNITGENANWITVGLNLRFEPK